MRPTTPRGGRPGPGGPGPKKPGKFAGKGPSDRLPQGPSQRQLRAGELIRHALAEVLRESEVADPALAGVSVTVSEVRMSPDLRHATCFVQPLGGGKSDEVVAALNRVSKFLRGRIGHMIALKFTPDLNFRHDESFEAAAHMDALFDSPAVKRDLAPSPLEGGRAGAGGARPDVEAKSEGGASPRSSADAAAHTSIPGPSALEGEGSD